MKTKQQPYSEIQTAILNKAFQHHAKGDIATAQKLYQTLVDQKAPLPPAYLNLAVILKNAGRFADAMSLYKKAIKQKPDFAEAYSNLGNLQREMGRLDEAIVSCRKAIEIKFDNPEAHNNLGNVQREIGQTQAATLSYKNALKLKPDFAEAHYNLGNAQKDLEQNDKALVSYQRALSLNPKYAAAYHNLGITLAKQGKLDEAAQSMQLAVQKAPQNTGFFFSLIDLLRFHAPSAAIRGKYVDVNNALKRVHIGGDQKKKEAISDETIQQLYRQSDQILASYKINISTNIWQLYRGLKVNRNCRRHKKIFDNYNVIPEFCFDCYKVTIKPRTVMELFKLMLVFDHLALPDDNVRKCIVEVRPEISGTYTGFIYCIGLSEAKSILKRVRPIIDQRIAKNIPAEVKRGCSEYTLAYPEYGRVREKKTQMMGYNKTWRAHEDNADKSIPHRKPLYSEMALLHNRVTLHDILVMRTWLAYASSIGDLSYLKITGVPVSPIENLNRPQFHPCEA